MLDAIAQTLAEQAATPAVPANVSQPQAALVVPQQTVAPVTKPSISAPESLSPSFSEPTRSASTTPAVARSNSEPHPVRETLVAVPSVKPVQPVSASVQPPASGVPVTDTAATNASEAATISQRLVLKQRLAELVAKEKPLKEAKLRAQLEAMAIALAQAGQFSQARQAAQDTMLAPAAQAALLAQIDAIAAKRPIAGRPRPSIALQPMLPKPPLPKPLLPKPPSTKVKTWVPAIAGRSLPSVLPFTPPQENTSYSTVLQTPPQYVSYSLNGFGRAIGGFGVVVDKDTSGLNGQNWAAAYATGNRFNADLWNGLSLIFPLAVPAPITSGFGWRVHPIRGDRRFHNGTDLGAPMGTPVLAAASGKVALSDWLSGYGLAVILSHQNDTRETLYGHLSQVFVKPGQWVEKGTVIGRVGSTGLSTGPHLHFELRQKTSSGWQAIDPGVQLKYALARLVKAMREG